MTVSGGQPASQVDPQASLRTELLGQILAAQFDLEAVIADLTRDGSAASALLDARTQLGALNSMLGRMANASGSALAEMRAEIAATVATSQSTAQQARSAAAGKADAAELISRAQEARAKVDEIMHGMKDFDPYLRFADERDQEEYRRREEERRAYIAAEQAKKTPEGHLNASGAAVGQMADAAAHGAVGSPEFQKRWDDLVASTEKLRAAAKANGVSTEEFDRRLREDLRAILKSKGLSDAQIEAQFAAHPDPLEAVKQFVKNETDLSGIQRTAERAKTLDTPLPDAHENDVRNIFASLTEAGVSSDASAPESGHGVEKLASARSRSEIDGRA